MSMDASRSSSTSSSGAIIYICYESFHNSLNHLPIPRTVESCTKIRLDKTVLKILRAWLRQSDLDPDDPVIFNRYELHKCGYNKALRGGSGALNLNTSISNSGLTNGDYIFVRKIDPNRRRELQSCIVWLGRKKQRFANFPVRQSEHTNRSLYLVVDRKLGAAESLAIDEMRYLELKCTLSIEANKPTSKSPIRRTRGFEARIKIVNFEFVIPLLNSWSCERPS